MGAIVLLAVEADGVILVLSLGALAAAVLLFVAARRSSRTGDRRRTQDHRDLADGLETAERERRRLDAILSGLDEGIVLFAADGRIAYQNQEAGRLLPARIERASQLEPPGLRTLVAAALSGEAPAPMDLSTGPGGSTTLRGAPVPMPGGEVLLVLRDLTQAHRLDTIRRDFVANASHELKTPVASIQALAETMRDASAQDPASIPRFAEQLRTETDRLGRIVSDLLDLSRLEGATLQPAAVRLDEVARDESDRLLERARDAGLDLLVTAGAPVTVRGSDRDLRLMVRNLLENAIQYTGPGGKVEVGTDSEDGQAIINVTDTGIGIPAREQGRVFERFYRVDRARSRETGGTGLGLSIVKHVAENHGGSVTVDSQLGRGSTFTVRLPVAGRADGPGILPR